MSFAKIVGAGLITLSPTGAFADVIGILSLSFGRTGGGTHSTSFQIPNIEVCQQIAVTAADGWHRQATLTCIDQLSGETQSFACRRYDSSSRGDIICHTPNLRQ